MINDFESIVKEFRDHFFGFCGHLIKKEKKLLILGDLIESFEEYSTSLNGSEKNLREITALLQEAVIQGNYIYFDVRINIGKTKFYFVNIEEFVLEEIEILEYLKAKEQFVDGENSGNILTINFKPFFDKIPSVRSTKNIGSGVEFLNRHLSSEMFTNIEKWKEQLFDFLKMHNHFGMQLLLNDRVSNSEELLKNIKHALKHLNEFDDNEKFATVKNKLQEYGFEPGLGKNVKEIKLTFQLLDDLLNSPDHIALKNFISRIPMVFNIAVISPHGFFAQEGVLGLPDTGGQVVYILDQVKSLEKALSQSLKKMGLEIQPKIVVLTRLIPNSRGTKCNEKREKIHGTKNCWIVRVPFKDNNSEIIPDWISRFKVWPYLESFAEESFILLKAEFNGRPDLIIGNYSDGNLVSYLLAKRFNVTQCCIAHALEKSKYLFSDIYWSDLEDNYNFSLQFTADLIAMNASDFQITSTYQEIAGTENTVGQYETHQHFTLPGLYRVENGVNLYHPKFNIMSPGVNESIYFPYTNQKNRISGTRDELNKMIFEDTDDPEIFGNLENPEKIPIFSMARLDENKNIVALARWFGQNKELQEKANLIIVAGKINADDSSDHEEKKQIGIMHNIINEYNLHNKIKWLGKLFRKDEAGEVYRIIAERRGLFVQPGLFEGFGLTVLEAMISGLPVIATKYGGPLEIIQNGINGFHIDPVNDEESIKILVDVVNRINSEKDFWEKISKASIERVNAAYNWKLYSQNLLSNAKIYGFWKYSTDLEKKDLEAYLDVLYSLLFKKRAEALTN